MRVYKFYLGFCIVTWTFWFLSFAISVASGGPNYAYNTDFYHFAVKIFRIAFLSCWLPIQPLVSIFALVYSLLREQKAFTKLICWNLFLVTPMLGLFLLFGLSFISSGFPTP